MSFLAPFLIRTLGPATVLACAGLLLAPTMQQTSRAYPTTNVIQMIGGQVWPTLLLIALAIVFATAIWLPLAVLTARRGYHAGLTIAPVSVIAQAMAPFWIAAVIMLGFGVPRSSAADVSILVRAVLPAVALAVVLLGFLAHATYLRAVSRQTMAAESGAVAPDAGVIRLEIAEDWLETIGRYAGLLIGALILIETVFALPGVGRLFVDGLRNGDAPFRSVALFDLTVVSFVMTVLFGLGADLVRARLDRRRAAASALSFDHDGRHPLGMAPHEPRWLAVLTVALGGLILVVLLILMTSSAGQPMVAQADARLLPPGSPGHAFGTDHMGRDVLAWIAGGIREILWQLFWLLFTAMFAVPFGLMAARLGRIVEGTLATMLNGLLTVSPFIMVVAWLAVHPNDAAGRQILIGYAIGPLLAVLIRDAVRAVWSGERRDASAAFGAVLMGLLVGAAYALVLDASLNFLGFGRLPAPMLGEMVASGQLLQGRAPWLTISPGVVLMALASSLILIGYGTLGLLRSRPTTSQTHHEKARVLARA